jgi:hypothetical protein
MSLVDEKKQTKTIDIYNFYCVFRIQFLFKPKSGEQLKDHKFYRVPSATKGSLTKIYNLLKHYK